MHKTDRAKLYGYKQLEVLDEADNACQLVTLAEDGRTLIGSGGTGVGYLSVDGDWCDRKELTPVDVEGTEVEPVPSSFAEPIQLFDNATYDELLDHDIRLVYEMKTDDDIADLADELKRGTVFRFPFSYRGGLQADAGFLLMSEDNVVFLLVGDKTAIEMIGLPQTSAVVDEASESLDADDLMDFDMI